MLHKYGSCLATQIKWANRLDGNSSNLCKVSVDGTAFRIYEPTPFSSKWFSQKFRGPGLRYEVAVCIRTGHIVWTHGPFPCGSFPDLIIYRIAMKGSLAPGEMVVADEGYNDPTCLPGSDVDGEHRKRLAAIRARKETVNRRFKQFFVPGHRFRHKSAIHSVCFHAVANLTQIMIEKGRPPFKLRIWNSVCFSSMPWLKAYLSTASAELFMRCKVYPEVFNSPTL